MISSPKFCLQLNAIYCSLLSSISGYSQILICYIKILLRINWHFHPYIVHWGSEIRGEVPPMFVFPPHVDCVFKTASTCAEHTRIRLSDYNTTCNVINFRQFTSALSILLFCSVTGTEKRKWQSARYVKRPTPRYSFLTNVAESVTEALNWEMRFTYQARYKGLISQREFGYVGNVQVESKHSQTQNASAVQSRGREAAPSTLTYKRTWK